MITIPFLCRRTQKQPHSKDTICGGTGTSGVLHTTNGWTRPNQFAKQLRRPSIHLQDPHALCLFAEVSGKSFQKLCIVALVTSSPFRVMCLSINNALKWVVNRSCGIRQLKCIF